MEKWYKVKHFVLNTFTVMGDVFLFIIELFNGAVAYIFLCFLNILLPRL